jgi:hypothetical protein
MVRKAVAGWMLLCLTTGAVAASLEAFIGSDSGREFRSWRLEEIPWGPPGPDGSRLAILEGPRDRPGEAFSYAFLLPDGVWVEPHWHCADARVFVARGTLLLGFGPSGAHEDVQAFPAGSYLVFPWRNVHFEGADGEVVIYGTGIGPWCTVE